MYGTAAVTFQETYRCLTTGREQSTVSWNTRSGNCAMYSSMSSYLFMPAVFRLRYSAVGSMKPATLAVSALCPPAHLKSALSVGENLPGRMSLPKRSFHVGESREGSGRKKSALEGSVHASGKYPVLRDLQETGHFNRHLILQNSGRRKCAKIARSALRSGCRMPTGPCYGGDF
jgi:hypothetical protein